MSETGGAAFPTTCSGSHPNDLPCPYYHSVYDGLSKLDWFAGQVVSSVVSGLLARTGAHEGEVLLDVELVTEVAFEIASAMVVESEERSR